MLRPSPRARGAEVEPEGVAQQRVRRRARHPACARRRGEWRQGYRAPAQRRARTLCLLLLLFWRIGLRLLAARGVSD